MEMEVLRVRGERSELSKFRHGLLDPLLQFDFEFLERVLRFGLFVSTL